MRITIENNELVYIYLLKIERKSGVVDKTIPFVMSDLLYDVDGNWIGIRIKDQFEEFSCLNVVDQFDDKTKVLVKGNIIEMFFDHKKTNVFKTCEQDVNLDIVGEQIYGIEIIIAENNCINKRMIPDTMIEYDS